VITIVHIGFPEPWLNPGLGGGGLVVKIGWVALTGLLSVEQLEARLFVLLVELVSIHHEISQVDLLLGG
jgi:hypothetical protein